MDYEIRGQFDEVYREISAIRSDLNKSTKEIKESLSELKSDMEKMKKELIDLLELLRNHKHIDGEVWDGS